MRIGCPQLLVAGGVFLAGSAALSQGSASVDSVRLGPRTVMAVRIDGSAPAVDGSLDDPVWRHAFADPRTTASDFVEQGPRPGTDPALRTIAAFAFDDEAMYVAVRAFDNSPDSIVAPYPRRDDETTSDWIFVELDTRHDRRNAFSMGCNPRSVEVDGVFVDDVNYDYSWNGVWQCAARIDSLGWTAEFRIPFSQLRASAPSAGTSKVTWGMNVYRHVVHSGESSDWSPRLPSNSGRVVSYFNELRGIELPRAQHPIELRPFVLTESAPHPLLRPGSTSDEQRMGSSGGADITARLPRGLTLDATVRPDFGQVEADPSQINLTTFETFLPEQRPFFVNGADAFNFNLGVPFLTRGDDFSADHAFYSRRIGAPPHGAPPPTAVQVDAPSATDVLGAAKVTGRVAGGWTLGAMGTVTRAENASFLVPSGISMVRVEPQTRFGALRAQRDFRDGASALGIFATDVQRGGLRDGLDSLLVTRATFLGVDGRHRTGDYELSGFTAATQVTGAAAAITQVMHGPGHFLQRPDARYARDDTTATTANGAAARLRFARISGGNLTWSLTGYGVTPRFDANDQGFQRNADWLLAFGTIRYEVNDAGRRFRRWAVSSDQIGAGWSFGGERRSTVANIKIEGDLWNYWGGSLSVDHELSDLSLDLLRGDAAIVVPARTTLWANLYSDSRRATQLTLDAKLYREPGTHSSYADFAPTLTSRVTDRLALTGSVEGSRSDLGWQYLDAVQTADGDMRTVLARIDESTLSITTRADYAFTPHLTLQAYAQPYFASGHYSDLKYARTSGARASIVPFGNDARRLGDGSFDLDFDGDGTWDASIPNADFVLHELHGSAVLRWEYQPGSELFLVWTQMRAGTADRGSLAPARDVGDLFRLPPRNVVLMKLSYRWEP
ncbi:MAG TPA: DUF5916 domain-containing protein [Gemmatimonadaceae bacterium]|nr:DUF5916 domain-containing protein [Gemmatimonadaceae bacterium]